MSASFANIPSPFREGTGGFSALEGCLVIEMGSFEAGPLAAQMLAQFGARVIKVERPGGDPVRHLASDPENGDSFLYLGLNWGKDSLCLDIRKPEGLAILKQLLSKADVLIESQRPGFLNSIGLDYESVSALNRRIIYASVKGFAPESPYADYLAFDPVAQATGGSIGLTGLEDGPPIRPGFNLGDSSTGLHCVLGVAFALLERERTGRGSHVQVSMQASVLNFCRAAFAIHNASGAPARREGNSTALGDSAPSGIFACKGGGQFDYCVVHTSRAGNGDWERLLQAMGRADLIGDLRYTTPQARWRNREEVERLVTSWTSTLDKFEVIDILGRLGVPAAPVLSTADLMADESLYQGGSLLRWQHPGRGEYVTTGFPIRLDGAPQGPLKGAPRLGEGGREVLAEVLGLDAAACARLEAEAILHSPT